MAPPQMTGHRPRHHAIATCTEHPSSRDARNVSYQAHRSHSQSDVLSRGDRFDAIPQVGLLATVGRPSDGEAHHVSVGRPNSVCLDLAKRSSSLGGQSCRRIALAGEAVRDRDFARLVLTCRSTTASVS
jgi:hypothetical protein